MVYGPRNRKDYSFLDLSTGDLCTPEEANTETGYFDGWVWVYNLVTGHRTGGRYSGPMAFDVISKKTGQVVDKGRP